MSNSAAIICTRNRPDALRHTLGSIAEQDLSPAPSVLVVDASDPPSLSTNRSAADDFSQTIEHYKYDGPPSAARQRNLGLRHLPPLTDIVFFLDDDITLHSGCLPRLIAVLNAASELVGVGAVEHREKPSPHRSEWWRQVFLIDHSQPGRVLPSGHVASYDRLPRTAGVSPTQWLSTCCCAYDRSAFEKVRFDETLKGALLEDRDLSYRISQVGGLAAVPTSTYLHHRSPINRRSPAQFSRDRLIQRYWFVDKNVSHTFRWFAFWWATLGQLIALLLSSKDHKKWKALRGHLQGIREIFFRSHPLLS